MAIENSSPGEIDPNRLPSVKSNGAIICNMFLVITSRVGL